MLYVIYKSMMMVLTMTWSAPVSGYSGLKWSLEGAVMLYNVFWTFFPVIIASVLDQLSLQP